MLTILFALSGILIEYSYLKDCNKYAYFFKAENIFI